MWLKHFVMCLWGAGAVLALGILLFGAVDMYQCRKRPEGVPLDGIPLMALCLCFIVYGFYRFWGARGRIWEFSVIRN